MVIRNEFRTVTLNLCLSKISRMYRIEFLYEKKRISDEQLYKFEEKYQVMEDL